MADSTCVKCGNTEFEVREGTPSGTERTLLYVQCSSCGGVVGVVENDDLGTMMRQQNSALKFVGVQFGMQLGLDTE